MQQGHVFLQDGLQIVTMVALYIGEKEIQSHSSIILQIKHKPLLQHKNNHKPKVKAQRPQDKVDAEGEGQTRQANAVFPLAAEERRHAAVENPKPAFNHLKCFSIYSINRNVQ
jgi:hypothetical protein